MATVDAECRELFAERFKALTGNAPFPWQESLFSLFLSETFPPNVSLPTGTGKTSIMALWLLALAEKLPVDARQAAIPRRLVWVVNRRVVVDQATNEAEKLRHRLNDMTINELEQVRCALRKLSATRSDELLGISTLRGQFQDNAEWRSDPSRPAVIIGTVDMIGSRLLFSGYGIGFKTKPLHAGFLGQDSLLIHDEAHLEPAFQELLTAIRQEQKRCKEFSKFRIMALTATSRAEGETFGLTEGEKFPPKEIPDPPQKPIHVGWRRQVAKKTIYLHESKSEKDIATEIAELALNRFKDTGHAVLVFVRGVEDVEKVRAKLPKEKAQQLTGTMRGLERDMLIKGDPIFRRFLPDAESGASTVYLVCTSAGEVGVNISADHLVCDLVTFDRMVQRFGRVNRFGNRNDTEIHILFSENFEDDKKVGDRRKKTLELIRRLQGDASPKALGELDPKDCLAAFTPTPAILPTSDILFDSWALTTIRGKLPGRPPVVLYLHGLSNDPPETHVAWRSEVGLVTGELLERYNPEELLDDYPLKPHELLRDRSDRVFKHLQAIAERCSQEFAWVVTSDGEVQVIEFSELMSLNKQKKPVYNLADCIVLLPPSVGGLNRGMLSGGTHFDETQCNLYDVADEWMDEKNRARRCRVWSNVDRPRGMRLIRTLDTSPDVDAGDEFSEEKTSLNRRYWYWYVQPKSADDDGSRTAQKRQELTPHLQGAENFAASLAAKLIIEPHQARAVSLAAKWHDCGKNRLLWQRSIGNRDGSLVLAKSGGNLRPIEVTRYRHEFGSLIDVSSDPEFCQLNAEVQDLVLHLIAAHHGRARPHFTIDETDPEHAEELSLQIAREVPRRFARLQRNYGRWGLAYLESLLRAADALASQNNDQEPQFAAVSAVQETLQ